MFGGVTNAWHAQSSYRFANHRTIHGDDDDPSQLIDVGRHQLADEDEDDSSQSLHVGRSGKRYHRIIQGDDDDSSQLIVNGRRHLVVRDNDDSSQLVHNRRRRIVVGDEDVSPPLLNVGRQLICRQLVEENGPHNQTKTLKYPGSTKSKYDIDILQTWISAADGKQRSARESSVIAAKKLHLEALKHGFVSTVTIDHVILRLARLGKDQCDKARTSFNRYVNFIRLNEPDACELPMSADHVVRFLDFENAAWSISAGSDDKGTCGKGILSGLTKFSEQFVGSFPTGIMSSIAVKSASRGMGVPQKVSESNISVALVICLELHALGNIKWKVLFQDIPCPYIMTDVATLRARDLVALIHMSLRGVSFDRMRLISFVDAMSSGNKFAYKPYVLAQSVDKSSSQSKMSVHDHCFLGTGLIEGGIELWIEEWYDSHGEGEFNIVDTHPKGSSIWEAECLSDRPVVDFNGTITNTLRAFASVAPISQNESTSKRVGLSMRSSRHFIASLTTALGEVDQQPAHSVGHWKVANTTDRNSGNRRIPMPFRYAGSELRTIVECQTRLRVFSRFQCLLLNPIQWQSFVPLQSCISPSFAFLVSSPAASTRRSKSSSRNRLKRDLSQSTSSQLKCVLVKDTLKLVIHT